jgi:hypothetical protein
VAAISNPSRYASVALRGPEGCGHAAGPRSWQAASAAQSGRGCALVPAHRGMRLSLCRGGCVCSETRRAGLAGAGWLVACRGRRPGSVGPSRMGVRGGRPRERRERAGLRIGRPRAARRRAAGGGPPQPGRVRARAPGLWRVSPRAAAAAPTADRLRATRALRAGGCRETTGVLAACNRVRRGPRPLEAQGARRAARRSDPIPRGVHPAPGFARPLKAVLGGDSTLWQGRREGVPPAARRRSTCGSDPTLDAPHPGHPHPRPGRPGPPGARRPASAPAGRSGAAYALPRPGRVVAAAACGALPMGAAAAAAAHATATAAAAARVPLNALLLPPRCRETLQLLRLGVCRREPREQLGVGVERAAVHIVKPPPRLEEGGSRRGGWGRVRLA